jgi:hypothetical protein
MTSSELKAEQIRFNALTPEAAKAIADRMEGKPCAIRSCWYCNGAHEHLKNAEYPFICITGCGVTYTGGFPARIVVLRIDGKLISNEDMDDFADALAG